MKRQIIFTVLVVLMLGWIVLKYCKLKLNFTILVEGSRLKCTLLISPCPVYQECFSGSMCFRKTVFWGNVEGQCCCEENSRKNEFVLNFDNRIFKNFRIFR